MSTLFLSLLLVVLIAIGLLMSKPIREHFADPSQGITDEEWEKLPQDKKKMMMSMCHFAKEAPTSPESAHMNAVCRYISKKLTLKQEFDGYKKETIDEMHPWCDYLKANYPQASTSGSTSASTASVSTLSQLLKPDVPKPANEELTQLQLERKCRRMALGMDETITPKNKEFWMNVCSSLDETRQLNQQAYDDEEEEEEEVQMPVKRRYRKEERDSCPDMSQYIKMDEIPCWNCNLP